MTTNAIKPLGQMPPEPQRWCSRYAAGTESDAMSRLTKWYEPEFKDDDQGTPYVLASDHAALRSYTEDCLARLRVAVALLDKLYEQDGSDDCTFMDEDNHALIELHEALATIGPLEGEKQGG